jgi:2-hydroxy-6-oxonona-2,4-dienedioate hydrolase
MALTDERSWFWQFIRWRENQRHNPPSLAELTNAEYKKAGLHRVFWSLHYQITDRVEDKASRIEAPVLVVCGEHDPITNQQWCEKITHLCPQGRLVVIPGAAHTLCYTVLVQLARVSRSFLNEIR